MLMIPSQKETDRWTKTLVAILIFLLNSYEVVGRSPLTDCAWSKYSVNYRVKQLQQ